MRGSGRLDFGVIRGLVGVAACFAEACSDWCTTGVLIVSPQVAAKLVWSVTAVVICACLDWFALDCTVGRSLCGSRGVFSVPCAR